MTATVKRLGVPFRWSAQDGLGANGKLVARSYRTELEGVFTRAGQKWVADRNSRLVPVAHSVPPFVVIGGVEYLLLEGATTNYLLYSQDFSNAAWLKTNVTVTANQVIAPDGMTTADKIEATASAAASMVQDVTTIATTAAAYAVYGRIGSGATDCNRFVLRNQTTATNLVTITINWSTGVVTGVGAVSEDAGVHGGVQWWRIVLTATTGITSGDDVRVYAGFDGASETAGEYAYLWQADLTPDAVASSPIPTTSATVARVADSLYFPFLPVPQEMTIYARFVEVGPQAGAAFTARLVHIGTGDVAAYAGLLKSTATGYRMYHNPASVSETASVGASVTAGDIVELRGVLAATGAPMIGASLDAGAEDVSAVATAQPRAAAWQSSRIYLNSSGTGNVGFTALRSIVVALGTKTMDEMRALAEAS